MSKRIQNEQADHFQGHNERSNYDQLKRSICDLYPDGLSPHEAEEATQNLVGFAQLLLEIKCRQAQTPEHE